MIDASAFAVEDRGYETACWIWGRAVSSSGYGVVRVRGRLMLAHRASYEQDVGPIPAGLELDHLCEVPLCIRGSHLEPVTHTENVRRGRAAKVTAEQVAEIRARLAVGAVPAEVAAAFGLDRETVYGIASGYRWAA